MSGTAKAAGHLFALVESITDPAVMPLEDGLDVIERLKDRLTQAAEEYRTEIEEAQIAYALHLAEISLQRELEFSEANLRTDEPPPFFVEEPDAPTIEFTGNAF